MQFGEENMQCQLLKLEKSQISYLNFFLKKVEKGKNEHKVTRKQKKQR